MEASVRFAGEIVSLVHTFTRIAQCARHRPKLLCVDVVAGRSAKREAGTCDDITVASHIEISSVPSARHFPSPAACLSSRDKLLQSILIACGHH